MKYREINLKVVAFNIKRKRKENNLSMEGLARRCGLSTGTINNIENCHNEPTLVNLATIAKTLDCSLEELFY